MLVNPTDLTYPKSAPEVNQFRKTNRFLLIGTSGQNQFIEIRALCCTPFDRALKMRFNEGSGSFLRPTIPEL